MKVVHIQQGTSFSALKIVNDSKEFKDYIKARVNTEKGDKLDTEALFSAIDKVTNQRKCDMVLTPMTKKGSSSPKIKNVLFEVFVSGHEKPVFSTVADHRTFMDKLVRYADNVGVNANKFRKNAKDISFKGLVVDKGLTQIKEWIGSDLKKFISHTSSEAKRYNTPKGYDILVRQDPESKDRVLIGLFGHAERMQDLKKAKPLREVHALKNNKDDVLEELADVAQDVGVKQSEFNSMLPKDKK